MKITVKCMNEKKKGKKKGRNNDNNCNEIKEANG